MSDPVLSEDEINRLHREKMQRRQAARKKVLATKTEERGLLVVHTGAGSEPNRSGLVPPSIP